MAMDKKAQIAPFILIITVVLIVAIVATVLIGESAFTRVRLANIADSALISGASDFCRSINLMRLTNNQLFLNYCGLQIGALSHGTWTDKFTALAYITAAAYLSQKLLDKAEEQITHKMGKNLRAKLYEAALGGGLVDEPEPYNVTLGEVDVEVDNKTGNITKVIGVNNKKYMERLSSEGSHFTQEFRAWKKNDKDNWWKANVLSYSYNTTNSTIRGHLSTEPDTNPIYDSYVRVELFGAPTDAECSQREMPIFFLWLNPFIFGPPILPGFGYDFCAWIKDMKFIGGGTNFGLRVTKKLNYQRLPFLGRNTEVTHKSMVVVTGGVKLFSDPADFKLQE